MTAAQLGLFAEAEAEAREQEVIGGEWWRGLPCRDETACFTHLIWGPDDPERSPREARKGASLRWKTMNDATPAQWADAIVAHLEDGVPRTFNRLMVELFDVTSTVAFDENPDAGLWLAVEAGRLEYTPTAPVYFRATQPRLSKP